MAHLLAGSDVRYEVGDEHPLSGLLVPDLALDDGRRIAELLHDARPVLLDLSGGALTPTGAGLGRPRRIWSPAPWPERPYGGMLIRPDGYVAWAAADVVDERSTLSRAAVGAGALVRAGHDLGSQADDDRCLFCAIGEYGVGSMSGLRSSMRSASIRAEPHAIVHPTWPCPVL